jgi:predicted ATPase/DNA-binding winged helix-turn-helix (wHTH) protein
MTDAQTDAYSTAAPRTDGATALVFGPFRLIPAQELLLEGDKPCRLGSRALDILTVLVERAGETVTKQDLLALAWRDVPVDDANLRVHVAALRKVLGDGHAGARYIINVMGRGYCFVAPVTRESVAAAPPPAQTPAPSNRHNLPAPLARVIGRNEAIEAIAIQIPVRRCVTIVGPGGIGKTTVASAVGERLLPVYDDGIWFIDMASITDRSLIPFAMASALGFSISSMNSVPSLVSFLRNKQALLVLDNCEHLVDAVAPLTEVILRQAPKVHILATSREALRAEGEWVYRLKPMEVPPDGESLTAAAALRYSAVQLFVERAAASLDGYRLSDADAPVAAEICRRLDGLPLAIELIAARVDLFGIRGLANILNDQFLLVSEGQRTAQPRQQNLLGALDWSYRLLTSVEQTILCRLAVFRSDFTLDAAVAVASGGGVSIDEVYSGILTLSTKSLITTDVTSGSRQHYHRLLHVTRAFVGQKLAQSRERRHILRLHAEYLCREFAEAEAAWETTDRKSWLATYGRTIDDVRAALEWAFSPDGDAALGVTLTATAFPLGFQLSLIDELKTWVERALLHARLLVPPQPLHEMRLNIALGRLSHNQSLPMPEQTAEFGRAVELSLQLNNLANQTEPLIALTALHLNSGSYTAGVTVVRKAGAIAQASGDPKAVVAVNRIAAQVLHFSGDHAAAHQLAIGVLDHPIGQIPLAYNSMPVDRRVSMRVILARIAWLRGFPDQAVTLAKESISFAQRDSAFSLCQALVVAAIPIALWNGDDASAAQMNATVVEETGRYSLAYWHSWATAYQALLATREGNHGDVPRLVNAPQLETFVTFAPNTLVPMTILRADNGEAGWCSAEIHRAQGEWLLQQGAPGATEAAEDLFERSLAIAGQQGARAWELRAAISLMRLALRRGRPEKARKLLASLVQHYAEGDRIADVQEAKALLVSATPPTESTKSFARRRREA